MKRLAQCNNCRRYGCSTARLIKAVYEPDCPGRIPTEGKFFLVECISKPIVKESDSQVKRLSW